MKSNSSTAFFPKVATKLRRSSLSPEEILTTRELMRLLKIRHRATIYNLINHGLPVLICGKNYRFIKHEVIAFLRRKERNGKVRLKKR